MHALTCLIMCREPLNMSQFVVGEQPKSYQLYAVSNHFGSLAGGHCKYTDSYTNIIAYLLLSI